MFAILYNNLPRYQKDNNFSYVIYFLQLIIFFYEFLEKIFLQIIINLFPKVQFPKIGYVIHIKEQVLDEMSNI